MKADGARPSLCSLHPCPSYLLPPAGLSESPPDHTAGCPPPPTAHSPPPADWLCQELTGAASKHPWAPAQGSALAIRALPWALQRRQGGGWRGASREEKAPSLLGTGAGGGMSRGVPSSSLLKPHVAQMSPIPDLFLVPQERGVSAHPTSFSTLLLSCLFVSWSLPIGLSEGGVGAWEGTRSRGKR